MEDPNTFIKYEDLSELMMIGFSQEEQYIFKMQIDHVKENQYSK
jgi:hypothetical protein